MECCVMSDILSTTCKTNKSLKGQCYRIHYTIALILKQLAICRSKNQVKGSRMSWFNGIKSKCLQPRVEIVRIQQSRVACQNFRVECQEMLIKSNKRQYSKAVSVKNQYCEESKELSPSPCLLIVIITNSIKIRTKTICQ